MLEVSGGNRPGMLQSALQCTGTLPTAKNRPEQKVGSANVEKSETRVVPTVLPGGKFQIPLST